jgi:competence protein ComEC
MSDIGPPGREALDLRLLPAAAAAWGACYLALGWSSDLSFLAAGIGLPAALGCLAMRHRWATVLAAAAGCAAAALLVTGLRVAARDGSPLAGLARAHAAADLLLTVQEDPRPLAVRGTGAGGPEVLVPARADRVTVGGQSWRLSARVLVFGPADGWQALLPSQHLRVRGRLEPPLGGDLTVAVLSTRGPPDAVGPPSWTQRAAGRVRAGLREAARGLPAGADGLLPGLVVGDTSALDPVLAADFRTTGLSHLVAVSGANLVFVVGAVLLVLRLFSAGPRLSAAAGGLATLGFVVLARPSASVLRAAAMGGLTLVALACGRPRAVLPALAASVLGLLLWHPELARSPGFALSVLATAGLIVLAPGWADRLRARGVPQGMAEALAVAAAACLVTAPLIAALGGMVSTVAIPANLLAAPAVPPATVLGVLAALLSTVWAGGAHAVAWLAGLPAGWIAAVAGHGAAIPAAAVSWPGGAAGGSILCGALASVVWAGQYAPVRRAALAASVGALLIALPVPALDPAWPPRGWLLVACDVAQGDALVLPAGSGAAVLVDTGPDPVAVDRCLRRLGIQRIPLLVLTHLHADHIGGLTGVLHGRQVGAIEIGPLHDPAWAWHSVQETAGERRIRLLTGVVGETREVAGLRLTVLGPRAAFHGTRSDPNNSSLVLRVVSRGHVVLLTGDAEIEAQRALLRDDPDDLPAEILKVPHHGSAYSDPEFLAAVHARVGIISVGAHNDYGHPSPLLLTELARLGVRALRTDAAGDIAVRDQDGRLEVVTHARGPPGVGAACRRRPDALAAPADRRCRVPGKRRQYRSPAPRVAVSGCTRDDRRFRRCPARSRR